MIKTKQQIISELYLSKDFNDCIAKMDPPHLRDDLKSEVITIVCEMNEERLQDLYAKGALTFFVVRIILNQIQSDMSPFFKNYRKFGMLYSVIKVEELSHIADVELNGRVQKEELEVKIKQFINDKLYWYDKAIVELYLKLGNYRAIEQETGIPWESCYGTVQRVIKRIRNEVIAPNRD